MAKFLPFKSVKPLEQWAKFFCSKNPSWYTSKEIDNILQKNLYSFLQIIKPILNKDQDSWKECFKKVRENYDAFHKKGYFSKSRKLAYYIYHRILSSSESFTGLIGLIHVEDLFNGVVKNHEKTLEKRKKLFADYLEGVRFQAEPVLLFYEENLELYKVMKKKMDHTPMLSFTTDEGIQHQLWCIDSQLHQKQIQKIFTQIKKLYIADGHHRVESIALCAQRKKKKDKKTISNYYILSYLIADTQVKIYDYNRLIKNLSGLTPLKFLEKLQIFYHVTDQGISLYSPESQNHISLYMRGRFYDLHIKPEYYGIPEGLGVLDTYLFEQTILNPILNIKNIKCSNKMISVRGEGGLKSISKIKELVDNGSYEAGFGFYPISIRDLKRISDLNLKMPPKSTFIRPKLLSGLTIYEMNNNL